MIIDKEYPATHSMSTSWYVVDDEGNVGIMDYNENGPVPWGVEETCGNELKYGHWEDEKNIIRFNLTNEQILDLLHNPHKPSEEKKWFDCVIKIDKEKKARFLKLYKNKDIYKDDALCISEELGLFEFDAFDCSHNDKYEEIPVQGTLKKMLDEGIILEVYETQHFDMNDQYNDGDVTHEKEFDNSPYYMFHQPYWAKFLPKKMHQPLHPVKIDQIPEQFRHRLHKIPGNFKDMDTFQIAQFYPCDAYSNEDPTYVVDGCSYQTSLLPDGRKIYTKISMYDYSFFPYCSEKNRFHCVQKCTSQCCNIHSVLVRDNPTVLIIFDPREEDDYMWKVKVLTNKVFQSSFFTSYILKFPYRTGRGGCCFKNDVENYMTQEYLTKVFNGSKGYIEAIIYDIKPRVIIATDKAMEVLNSAYCSSNGKLTVDGIDYPTFPLSELSTHSAIIEELATLPYQGKIHPLLITMEKMEELVKNGIAKEYQYMI